MRPSSILMVFLLCLAGPAQAENPAFAWATILGDRIEAAHQAAMPSLAAERDAVIASYDAAMRQFRVAVERGKDRELLAIFLPNDGEIHPERWIWTAPNGDSIRRIGNGVFRLAQGNYRQNWFFEVECTVIDWPNLYCDDDSQRIMSAPDERTVVFDGVTYTR